MSAINTRRSLFALRRFLDEVEPGIERALYHVWKEGADIIDAGDIVSSSMPTTWLAAWQAQYTQFVNGALADVWLSAIGAGARHIGDAIRAREHRSIGVGDLTEDRTGEIIRTWVQTRGGALITNLTSEQFHVVRQVLEESIVNETLSPAATARKLRPLVGLDKRQAAALRKYEAALVKEGVSRAATEKLTARYSKKMLSLRATRIARTEASESYNMGSLLRVQEALDKEELIGVASKEWLTAGDERVCPECGPLEGKQVVGLQTAFESDKGNTTLTPPMHPMCRCTTLFSVD